MASRILTSTLLRLAPVQRRLLLIAAVSIKDLAEQMARLSGFSLRDAHHPSGDIEIICTGLRPGEKLFEELLIDAESEPTEHPLIYRAREQALPPPVLWHRLDAREIAIARHDQKAVFFPARRTRARMAAG
jgi:FlaA1/EpsC-like NDP-sugar epimerase